MYLGPYHCILFENNIRMEIKKVAQERVTIDTVLKVLEIILSLIDIAKFFMDL